jgi:NitT/TauT family transport system substrate-binding protein
MKKELALRLRAGLAAFAGRTIGRNKTGPSAIDYTELFTGQLKAAKIPFREKWFPSWAAMEEAVARGEIDAALSTPPYDQMFLDSHPGLAIYELRNLYARMPCCRQLVTRDQLRNPKMREKYVRFERALIQAARYYRTHKPETCNLLAKLLDLKPEVVREVFNRPGYELDPNPNLKGSIAFYNALKSSIGTQDVSEAVDTSIYEDALTSLVKQSPADDYYRSALKEFKLTN